MRFHEKLKELRTSAGLSQQRLASRLGVSRQAVTKWEREGGLPDVQNLFLIAKLFSTTMDDLLSGEPSLFEGVVPSASLRTAEPVLKHPLNGIYGLDIRLCPLKEVFLYGVEGDYAELSLSGPDSLDLSSLYTLRMTPGKRNTMEIGIRRRRSITKEDSRTKVSAAIGLPARFPGKVELAGMFGSLLIQDLRELSLEFDGSLRCLDACGVSGAVTLNSFSDMDLCFHPLCGTLTVNQISAHSTLTLPANAAYQCDNRGRHTEIVDDFPPTAQGENRIELNGMNARLTILKEEV